MPSCVLDAVSHLFGILIALLRIPAALRCEVSRPAVLFFRGVVGNFHCDVAFGQQPGTDFDVSIDNVPDKPRPKLIKRKLGVIDTFFTR